MIERVDERQRRCTIQGSSIVESGSNVDGCFISIWNAEIDLPHAGAELSLTLLFSEITVDLCRVLCIWLVESVIFRSSKC